MICDALALTRFGWNPIIEKGYIIGCTQAKQSVTLEPGGQLELSGARSRGPASGSEHPKSSLELAASTARWDTQVHLSRRCMKYRQSCRATCPRCLDPAQAAPGPVISADGAYHTIPAPLARLSPWQRTVGVHSWLWESSQSGPSLTRLQCPRQGARPALRCLCAAISTRELQGRYQIMREYMPKVGTMGLDMMFRTCTVQA